MRQIIGVVLLMYSVVWAQDVAHVQFDCAQIISSNVPVLGANMTYLTGRTDFLDDDLNTLQSKINGGFDAETRILRFPGGTIANTYRWKDAIGPQEDRKDQVHGFNCSAGSISSAWGPDEAGRYAERIGATLLIVVPINSSADNLADFVEYMNSPTNENPRGGTAWALERAANGHPEPYHVKYWEIGNESGGSKLRTWPSWPLTNDNNETDGCLQSTTQAGDWWAYGGVKSFTMQKAGRYSDWGETGVDSATEGIRSEGQPHETFFVKFPPINNRDNMVVRVGPSLETNYQWTRIDYTNWAAQGPTDHVYSTDPSNGRIYFGDDVNGKILPADYFVFVSYESGPHDGYIDICNAMTEVDPSIKVVCSHFKLLDYRTAIVAGGARIDGYQVHSADEGYFVPPDEETDYFDEILGRAYFGALSRWMSQKNILETKGFPAGTEIVVSESGIGKTWSALESVMFGKTVMGALAQALQYDQAVTQLGTVSNYPLSVLMLNYMAAGTASIIDQDDGFVHAYGVAQSLLAKHYGSKILKMTELDMPTRTLGWHGLSWSSGELITESIPKVVVNGSVDVNGDRYIMAINTTADELVTVQADFLNGDVLLGKPLSSWILMSTNELESVNSETSTNIMIIADDDPFDVEISQWHENRIQFPVDPASIRIVRIENYTGSYRFESMDHLNLWMRSTDNTIGSRVEVSGPWNGLQPRWNLTYLGSSNEFRITNVYADDKPLRPSGAAQGSRMEVSDPSWTGDWTKWNLRQVGGNVYRPVNKGTGLPFKPASADQLSDVVSTAADDYSNWPRWRLLKADD